MIFFTIKFRFLKLFCSMIFIGVAFFCAAAQSTDQGFPTAVTSNQIEGAINARDLGDSRQTSYFYAFNGTQGDIFINVVTKNFNGAVDIFNADNLQPITKIIFYAGEEISETGRVFYLRKPEKMILRVQGRTPNDDPATFQIKFAGSFAPALEIAAGDRPETPKVARENQSDIIVNSVGTIIGVKPKPSPPPVIKKEEQITADKKDKEIVKDDTEPKTVAEITEKKPEKLKKAGKPKKAEKPVEVIVSDTAAEPRSPAVKPAAETKGAAAKAPARSQTETVIDEAKKTESAENDAVKTEKADKTKALASIRLTIELKNGEKFVRPMNEVFSVNIDDGKMTVITKDGEIRRFSILDIAKTTIE